MTMKMLNGIWLDWGRKKDCYKLREELKNDTKNKTIRPTRYINLADFSRWFLGIQQIITFLQQSQKVEVNKPKQ